MNFKDLPRVAFDDLQSALEGRSAPVLDPMAEDPVCQRAEAFPADKKTERNKPGLTPVCPHAPLTTSACSA